MSLKDYFKLEFHLSQTTNVISIGQTVLEQLWRCLRRRTYGLVTDATTTYHVVAVSGRWWWCMDANDTHASSICRQPATWAVVSRHHLCSHLDEEVIICHTAYRPHNKPINLWLEKD